MKRLRVLILVHDYLVSADPSTELSRPALNYLAGCSKVAESLEELGHVVQILGISDDLRPIRTAADAWQPHIVFNFLLEVRGISGYDGHVAGYLELLGVAHTGCTARAMILAHEKSLAKKVLFYHQIPTPKFSVTKRGRAPRVPRDLRFPLIVKANEGHGSLWLSQASVVRNHAELRNRVEFVHRNADSDAIIEEYIAGRELTIGVLGNDRLQTLPVWETVFQSLPRRSYPIKTERIKWDVEYKRRLGIRSGLATNLPDGSAKRAAHLAKATYRSLGLSGYARIDMRLAPEGDFFVLEANAVPSLAPRATLPRSAQAAGISYAQLIHRILTLGLANQWP